MKKSLLLTALLAASLPSFAAVPDGWTVTPDDGSTVTEIKSFQLYRNNGNFDPYVGCKIKINDVEFEIEQKVTGTFNDTNTITIKADPITAKGTYNIVVPSGTFDIDYNWMMEEGDPNPEISFTLYIGDNGGGGGDNPDPGEFTPIVNEYYTITPAQGRVAQIKDFTVQYDRSGLFPEGYVANPPKLINETTGDAVATFKVIEGGGLHDVILQLDEAYTTPGTYLVRIPDESISDYMDEAWPAADFRYVIDPSLTPDIPQENVVATPESGSTVDGIDQLMLYFPNMYSIYASGPAKDGVKVKMNGLPLEGVTASFEFDSMTMGDGEIGLKFTPALSKAGEYEIYGPANALSLEISTFDTRYNNEFTLSYTLTGMVVAGDKFTVAPLTYKVVDPAAHTCEVTWPSDESEYAGVTSIPATVAWNGQTWDVTAVGRLAFSQVTGISEITLPESIKTIGDAAFWESSLSKITIPASVTTIEGSAFESSELTEITIPETVTSLGTDVLYTCKKLETINYRTPIDSIPGGFAQGCVMLRHFDIPQTVRRIGEFAFSECEKLTGVVLPAQLETLERFAFAYCPEITYMEIPETVTTLGHGVFYQTGLTEASLPEHITVIPDGFYQCCTALTEFTTSNNVTEIETQAFYWDFGLTKFTFGEKMATIGAEAFKGDRALTEVISLNPVPPAGASFEPEVYANATLKVPDAAVEAYRAAEGWKEFSHITSLTGIDGIDAENPEQTVEIYDMAGRKVYEGQKADINLPKGIYMIVTPGDRKKVIL